MSLQCDNHSGELQDQWSSSTSLGRESLDQFYLLYSPFTYIGIYGNLFYKGAYISNFTGNSNSQSKLLEMLILWCVDKY